MGRDTDARAIHEDVATVDRQAYAFSEKQDAVKKPTVAIGLTEGVSKQAADNLATFKKEALITAAEKRLSGTGWLPTCLRVAA